VRALEAENAHLRQIIQQLEVSANSPGSAPIVPRRKAGASSAAR